MYHSFIHTVQYNYNQSLTPRKSVDFISRLRVRICNNSCPVPFKKHTLHTKLFPCPGSGCYSDDPAKREKKTLPFPQWLESWLLNRGIQIMELTRTKYGWLRKPDEINKRYNIHQEHKESREALVCYKSQCLEHDYNSLITQKHLRELQNICCWNSHITVQSKITARLSVLEICRADGNALSVSPKDVECNTSS